jgi:hypothetical protein
MIKPGLDGSDHYAKGSPDRRCLSRECQVVDLSAGGAGLELPRAYDLPKRFEFLHGNTRPLLHAGVHARFSHWHKLRGHAAKVVSVRRLEQAKEWQQPALPRARGWELTVYQLARTWFPTGSQRGILSASDRGLMRDALFRG